MIKRCAVLAGLLAVALGTSACAATVAKDAQVDGLVQICGGPMPPPPATQPRCWPASAKVSALNQDGQTLASAQTSSTGRFEFMLAPGRYTLLARSANLTWRSAVLAQAHRSASVTITVPVP